MTGNTDGGVGTVTSGEEGQSGGAGLPVVGEAAPIVDEAEPEDDEKTIFNCHLHLFTIKHVPKRFLPLGFNTIMRAKILRKPFVWLLDLAIPWSKRDLFHRFGNFIEVSYQRSQSKIFDIVRGYYPPNTRFVALPMDMEYMGAGKVPEDLDQQHSELARLGRDSKGLVIPFAAIDPRRPNVGSMLKKLVEVDGFKGVKIYPPLGYQPNAEELMKDVYPYCEEKGIPVMTHCSTGGVRHKDMSKETTTGFADPTNYLSIMDKFPNLKICLGHFGGRDEWEKHRTEPWLPGESTSDKSWLGKITDVMKTGKYPNLFADISYTIFSFEENVALLRVLMSNDKIASQVLFGSDFYMVEKSKMAERDLAIRLRADLTEGVFWKIANENPKRYLGL